MLATRTSKMSMSLNRDWLVRKPISTSSIRLPISRTASCCELLAETKAPDKHSNFSLAACSAATVATLCPDLILSFGKIEVMAERIAPLVPLFTSRSFWLPVGVVNVPVGDSVATAWARKGEPLIPRSFSLGGEIDWAC